MQLTYVPYHLDQHHPDLAVPLPAGADVTEITVELPAGDVFARLVPLYSAVAGAVAASPETPVVSGDCTVTLAMAAGMLRAGLDPSVVWIDAHGDVQTLETSASGYVGGTALRLLLGYRREAVLDRLGVAPFASDRVLLVDARDLDPPEVEFLASSAVRRVPLSSLPSSLPEGQLLVNVDLDVLAPSALPGARYVAPGGPSVATLVSAVRTILATGRVEGLHIACTWEPGRPDLQSLRGEIIAELLTP
ncbi:arginase family protein [Tenggerimyces flavus]|uniref:Arginase family protein n=1 Tax=Tenggerimyces flavus TaxID=1708749 RepID=A0ABV7YJ59_9ACTN|nr:arginase family protein [Tenggerimyces flavus]MBM7787601.1 arginase [Tenggerimyces flavus]